MSWRETRYGIMSRVMPYVFYGTPYSKRATVRTWSGLSPIGVNAGTHIRGVLQSARGLA